MARVNGCPGTAAHRGLHGVEHLVQGAHALAVVLAGTGALGEERARQLLGVQNHLRLVAVLARQPLCQERELGLNTRRDASDGSLVLGELVLHEARNSRLESLVRRHREQVAPAAVLRNKIQSAERGGWELAPKRAVEVLEQVALSLAAADVARLEGEDEEVLNHRRVARRHNRLDGVLDGIGLKSAVQLHREVEERGARAAVAVGALHAGSLVVDCGRHFFQNVSTFS